MATPSSTHSETLPLRSKTPWRERQPFLEPLATTAPLLDTRLAAVQALVGGQSTSALAVGDALLASRPAEAISLVESLLAANAVDREIDLEARRMFEVGGPEVTITAMEFDLLAAFLANPNRVLSRDQLLMRTRNREWEPFDRSIDIRIGRLRRKVEPDPAGEPRCIKTVRSAGYMFVPDAR